MTRPALICDYGNAERVADFEKAIKEQFGVKNLCSEFLSPNVYVVDMWQEDAAESLMRNHPDREVFLIGYSIIKGEPPVFIRKFERKIINKEWRENENN
jgi:hypothetical protein